MSKPTFRKDIFKEVNPSSLEFRYKINFSGPVSEFHLNLCQTQLYFVNTNIKIQFQNWEGGTQEKKMLWLSFSNIYNFAKIRYHHTGCSDDWLCAF